MDPCYSWFGCRRVELRGHTGAPPRSQLSFLRSEQSASEHLEHRRNIKHNIKHKTAVETEKTHMHTHSSAAMHLQLLSGREDKGPTALTEY